VEGFFLLEEGQSSQGFFSFFSELLGMAEQLFFFVFGLRYGMMSFSPPENIEMGQL